MLYLFVSFASMAQTLNDYLKIAEENSLVLQGQNYKYQSSLEKIAKMGGLPNTDIQVGFFIQETETRVGTQKGSFSLSQSFPWFGTLKAKKESALYQSQVELNKNEVLKIDLFLNVKKAYFELYELKQRSEILKKNIEILDTYKKLAITELANNRSTLVDVLKIKIERNEVSNDLKTVYRSLNARKEIFNLLLNREANEYVEITEEIEFVDALPDKNLILQNPRILEKNYTHNVLLKDELVAEKENSPKIKLGMNYVPIEELPIMNLKDNGKDIIMPSIGLSVPIFNKRYSSKKRQLQFEQKAIKVSKENIMNELVIQYEETLLKRKNILESIKMKYENIRQINEVQKVLMSVYPTSKIDFDQILEVQQLKLKFELEKVNLEKENAILQATLESLIVEY